MHAEYTQNPMLPKFLVIKVIADPLQIKFFPIQPFAIEYLSQDRDKRCRHLLLYDNNYHIYKKIPPAPIIPQTHAQILLV